jgi:hypothetical protein
MAMSLIRTTDTVDLVHSDDPSAAATNGDEGWRVARAEDRDATRITIRPLNGWEMLQCQALASEDASSQHLMVRAVLEKGLVAIDGDESAAKTFIDSPDKDHLFTIFNAVIEAGAVPLARGRGSSSTGPVPTNGAVQAAANRRS